jgi:nitrogen-specific signal transduction histidine kinase
VKPFYEAELHASAEMALYKQWHDRRSRSREQHAMDVLGALRLGIASVDQGGAIRMMNRAADVSLIRSERALILQALEKTGGNKAKALPHSASAATCCVTE